MNIKQLIATSSKKPRLIGIILSLLIMSLYASTMPNHNIGYGDSDLFLTLGYYLGVGPSPGYPLYILLLYMFLHLPLNMLSLASKGHLLSVLLGGFTIYWTYQTIFLLLRNLNAKNKAASNSVRESLVAVIMTISLGTSHLFWLYHTIAEKFALLTLFVVVFSYFAIKLVTLKLEREKIRSILIASVCLGLAISHHPVALVLLIPYFFIVYKTFRRSKPARLVILASTLIVSVLAPLLLLFWINERNVAVSWHFEPTVAGWYNHIVNVNIYGTEDNQGNFIVSMAEGLEINDGVDALFSYVIKVMHGFGWWTILPLAMFIQQAINKRNTLINTLLALSFSTAIIIPFMLKWPDDWEIQGRMQGFWVLGSVMLVPLMSIGYYVLVIRLRKSASILALKKSYLPYSLFVPISLIILQVVLNGPLVMFKQHDLIPKRYQTILKSVKENSLVTCYTKTACSALLFEQTVNGLRLDVDIIPLDYELVRNVINEPDMRGFAYPSNPYLITDVVTWNMRLGRPVYAVELSSYYYQFFGMDIPFMYYVPQGYFGELTYVLPKEIVPPADYEISQLWLSEKVSDLDPNRSHLITTPARDHLTNAQAYLQMDRRFFALNELGYASNLFYRFGSLEKKQIEGVRTHMEQMQPKVAFAPGAKVETASQLLEYVPDLLKKNYHSRALKAVQGAVLIEPTNIKARLMLAGFYKEMGDYYFSKLEYMNVIRLDPENQEAIDALAQLSI